MSTFMFIRRLYECWRSGFLYQERLPGHAQRECKNLRTSLCKIANWSNTRESGALTVLRLWTNKT